MKRNAKKKATPNPPPCGCDSPRCAKCGSEHCMTIETLPPLEVCQRCGEPWSALATPGAPDDAE